MQSKTKAVISYLGLFVTGIIFLAIEKEDEFVRKSAAQAFVFGVTVNILNLLIKSTPPIGSFLSFAFLSFCVAILIFLIYKANKNIYYKLPILGDISENYVLNWFSE